MKCELLAEENLALMLDFIDDGNTIYDEAVLKSFINASYEAKHLVIAQLVDRIEIRKNDGYDITIHWRMTAEQFLGRKKEESA